MLKKSRNKKGFTLIELIVVIAVLGILILLAAPKFLGYGEKAKLTQIKADIKSYETAIGAKLIDNEEYTKNWDVIQKEVLEEKRDSNSLFYIEGLVEEDYEFNGEYLLIEENLIKTNLDGDFYLGIGGEVYYHEDGLKIKDSELNSDSDANHEEVLPEVETPGENETVDEPEITEPEITEPEIEETTPVEPEPEKEKVYEATEADFKWNAASGNTEISNSYTAVGKSGVGYFTYTGPTEDPVKIPNKIGETSVISYYKMFSQTNVKKVISDNPNVTSTADMFISSTAASIDVSELNTSKVENMDNMFYNSQATSIVFGENFNTSNVTTMRSMFEMSKASSLDLSSFDTSKVTTMYGMFNTSQATSIVFGENFNTSNVTNMGVMFQASNVKHLDLSKFNTSKVTSMSSMFANSKSETINLSSFNTSSVTESNRMFFNALKLQSLDISSFDTSGIGNVQDMFAYMTLKDVYVKSEADATKLKDSRNKPTGMTFHVKGK